LGDADRGFTHGYSHCFPSGNFAFGFPSNFEFRNFEFRAAMNTCIITIDGQSVDVTAGETVLQAARRSGLDIPTLCYLENAGR